MLESVGTGCPLGVLRASQTSALSIASPSVSQEFSSDEQQESEAGAGEKGGVFLDHPPGHVKMPGHPW